MDVLLHSAMSKQDIFTALVEVLHEMFEIDRVGISMQSNLYTDFDIDSIDAVDLAVKLKQMTGKRFDPEVFKHIRTVQEVVDALADLLAKG